MLREQRKHGTYSACVHALFVLRRYMLGTSQGKAGSEDQAAATTAVTEALAAIHVVQAYNLQVNQPLVYCLHYAHRPLAIVCSSCKKGACHSRCWWHVVGCCTVTVCAQRVLQNHVMHAGRGSTTKIICMCG